MTKSTAVAPGGECPRWIEFLTVVTASDDGLQDYLQRLAGYVLTGCTHEHTMAFLAFLAFLPSGQAAIEGDVQGLV